MLYIYLFIFKKIQQQHARNSPSYKNRSFEDRGITIDWFC